MQSQRFLTGRQALPADAISNPSRKTKYTVPGARGRISRPLAVASLAGAWAPLGPGTVVSQLYGPVTGRVTSIAVDPNDASGNTVYLGTTGGGVWKSTNAAGPVSSVTFAPLTDTLPAFAQNAGTALLPSLSMGAVSVQPTSSLVLLAGTGDPNDSTDSYYGEGILRSSDGGQTWTAAVYSQDGVNGHHALAGLATSGFAWNTANPTLVVAALSTSAEAETVGASMDEATPGLYFSNDAGSTWQMATVNDGSRQIEGPVALGIGPVGASATSVVWNQQRQMFFAALAGHGYFSSLDGQTWNRLAHQPGNGLTATNCPTLANGQAGSKCPILRGTLSVQPVTGDMYALTVDANNNDQGLWQDLCSAGSTGRCSTGAPAFANRIDGGALEVGQGAAGSSTQIGQGSYNLSLMAVPADAGGTLLLAGTVDLYRCTLGAGANACSFRNTTNAGNGCNASSGVAPAQHTLAAVTVASGSPLIFVGNDGGLWRSPDGIAQTGPPCASTDAGHFQNLNSAIGSGGSLAEIVGFAQDASQPTLMTVGLGALGSATSIGGVNTTVWPQLSGGEGGFPLIDNVAPANWYVSIGTGVNLKACTLGASCTASDFSGSADVGAIQTAYDTALLAAPMLLDPQQTDNLLTATCRVWRGPAGYGSAWNPTNALSPAMDGGLTPCTPNSALIRSLGAGGPAFATGLAGNRGSEVLYAGMAGVRDGGGNLPGHLFLTKSAQTADASTPWLDITGSPVSNSTQRFNASGFDLSAITVDPHDITGGTVYATVMGFGTGAHVYRSIDFGAHWTSLDANLPDAPANALVVDPNDANTVYVAMDTGVYVTQAVATCETQNCWSVLGSGLPNAPVTTLQAGEALPTADGRVGMLRAGTYGRGLWQTPLLTAHSSQQPRLSLSPGSLHFLAQQVGTQSDALSISLLSFGNAAVNVTSISVTGDFTETDTCAQQTLAVGQNCTVSLRFAPTATGGRSGLLTVYGNIPGGQVTAALTGTGTAPAAVVLTPLQVSFAPTLVNQTAKTQIVTISNTGGDPATIESTSVTGDFFIAANTCGTTLPSQTGCSIAVGFQPATSGSRSGVLSIVDSAGTQTAQLSGTGQSPPTDTLDFSSLTFASQQVGTTSAVQQVTLANAGDVPLTLVTAVVATGDFTAVNNCGTSLAAHSSCAVNVSFVPTATGTRTGVLQITDEFRQQTVVLSGSGVAPAGVSLSPSTLSFGSVGVGLVSAAANVTLSNNGGEPLLISATTTTGDFRIASTTCSTSLLPGTACNMNISFAPAQAGVQTGSVVITDNATGGKQSVALTGMGIDFELAGNGPTSQTVTSGAIATFPLKLTSADGLVGAVSWTCTGTPANTACTVNPSPAQLGGTTLVSVTLQTGVTLSNNQGAPSPATALASRAWLCTFAIPAWCFSKRRRRASKLSTTGTLLLLMAIISLVSGCGTTRLIPLPGQGSGGGAGGSPAATAPGNYTISVAGACDGITHAVQLSLAVQ